jgi:hypothetical protein
MVLVAVKRSNTVVVISTFVVGPTTPLAVNAFPSTIPVAVDARTISNAWRSATVAAVEHPAVQDTIWNVHQRDARTNGTMVQTIALVLNWIAIAPNLTAAQTLAVLVNVAFRNRVHAIVARANNIDASPIRVTPFLVIYARARNASHCRLQAAINIRAR